MTTRAFGFRAFTLSMIRWRLSSNLVDRQAAKGVVDPKLQDQDVGPVLSNAGAAVPEPPSVVPPVAVALVT